VHVFAREVRSWFRPPPLGQHRLSRTGSRQRSQLLRRASALLCFTAWYQKLSTTPKRGFYNLTNGFYLSSQFLSLPPPLFVADIVVFALIHVCVRSTVFTETELYFPTWRWRKPLLKLTGLADVVGAGKSLSGTLKTPMTLNVSWAVSSNAGNCNP
jgi:hypothetical protein